VARGTHASLIAEGGLYAELYHTQYVRGQESLANAS
jgi:ABC-type multidrug transport system fused ATPase/permease subunit